MALDTIFAFSSSMLIPFTVSFLKAFRISRRTPAVVAALPYLLLPRQSLAQWLRPGHPARLRPGRRLPQKHRRHSDWDSWHTTRYLCSTPEERPDAFDPLRTPPLLSPDEPVQAPPP